MNESDQPDVPESTPPEMAIKPARPIARNLLATSLVELQDRLRGLWFGEGFEQFIACAVQATNVLDVSEDEMRDRRTQASYVNAIQNCAILGLLPGSALGHAYFAPFTFYRGGPKQHEIIQLIPGYRGLLELAWKAGFLVNCDPEVVLDGEPCERWHDTNGPQIMHEIPIPRGKPATLETIEAAYCTYTARGGHSVVGAVVESSELKELRNKSGPKSVWRQKNGYLPMCLKTSVRRTSKRWRQTQNLSRAVLLDEQAEEGLMQDRATDDDVLEAQRVIDLDDIPPGEE